jgi:hypothetical protein
MKPEDRCYPSPTKPEVRTYEQQRDVQRAAGRDIAVGAPLLGAGLLGLGLVRLSPHPRRVTERFRRRP